MSKEKNEVEIKSCYSHIGGKFGNRLTIRFLELGWIITDLASKNFLLTDHGKKEFKKLGIDYSDL